MHSNLHKRWGTLLFCPIHSLPPGTFHTFVGFCIWMLVGYSIIFHFLTDFFFIHDGSCVKLMGIQLTRFDIRKFRIIFISSNHLSVPLLLQSHPRPNDLRDIANNNPNNVELDSRPSLRQFHLIAAAANSH